MNTKIIISFCLLLAGIAVQAANKLPQGRWKVEQVTIKKNTDGNIQTTVYNTAADVNNYFPCLQEGEIKDSKNIVLSYPDGTEETAEYTLEGNQLMIHTAAAMQSYQYSINGEKLTLTTVHNYVNNMSTGEIKQIEEKWTIILKK